jgi:transcriptional regulator with XRE-family HTH domain
VRQTDRSDVPVERVNGSGPNGPHLGVRIRALRKSRSISARELADRAGVAPAYLSRLENGRLSPTVSTLTRVMQALGEPVSRVFGDDDLAGPVVRVADRRVIRNRGVDDFLLSPTRSGRLEVIESIIQPGEGSGDPPYSHPGDEECIVVLDGMLRVWVDDEEYDLEPGDAITFPCRSPHRWTNPAAQGTTRALWVLTPAGY